MDIMERKIGRISIDIDSMSISKMLWVYFTAKKWFPDVPIEVEISSSGMGFHVIIYKDVKVKENLMWRALLGDDPVRIAYSLRRMLLNDDENIVDIIFIRKNKKDVKRIDIEKILKKYNINPYDVNESNFDEIYKMVYTDISKIVGKVYTLVIPINEIDSDILENLYQNEGIKINKVKSYDKENNFYLIINKIGNPDFSEELKVIRKYIDFTDFWVKEEVVK